MYQINISLNLEKILSEILVEDTGSTQESLGENSEVTQGHKLTNSESIGTGVSYECSCGFGGRLQNLKIHSKRRRHRDHLFAVINGRSFTIEDLLPKKIIPLFTEKPKLIHVTFN